MKLSPGNAQHIGTRSRQQDSFGFSDPADAAFVAHGGVLAVLADGMGGLERGEEASRAAVRSFLAAYGRKRPDEDIPSALEAAAGEANAAVNELAGSAGADAPGSTLVAAVVHDAGLYWVAAGDSGLYLWRRGALTQLNIPHVYARALDMAVEAGALSGAAAAADPQRDALTSFLGVGRQVELDRNIRPLPLEAGDRVLLCSDGLSKTLDEAEIAQALASGDAQQACEELVRRAVEREVAGQDNVTALLLDAAAEHGRKRKWRLWKQ